MEIKPLVKFCCKTFRVSDLIRGHTLPETPTEFCTLIATLWTSMRQLMGPTFKSNIAKLPLRNALSSSSACAASEQNVGWEHTVSWIAELILRWSRSSLRGACRGGSLKSSLYSSNHVWTKVNRWLREQEAKLSPFKYFDTAAQQKLTWTPRTPWRGFTYLLLHSLLSRPEAALSLQRSNHI